MKKMFLFLLLGTMCSLLLFSKMPREITVGLNESYPPYTFVEENKRPTGIFPEIIDEAAKIVGVKVEYKPLLWARMTKAAINGKIYAAMGLFKTTNRQKDFVFSKSGLIYEGYSFFTLKGSDIRYSGALDELENVTIGVVQDYKYGTNFKLDNLKIENCLTDKNLIEKLLKKRFEIAIGNKSVIDYYAKKLGVKDKIECLTPPVSTGYSHVIAFSRAKRKQAEELAREFSEAIETIKNNGTFKAILDKYKFDNKENSRAGKPMSIDNSARGNK